LFPFHFVSFRTIHCGLHIILTFTHHPAPSPDRQGRSLNAAHAVLCGAHTQHDSNHPNAIPCTFFSSHLI
jgi:hypothetical protein